MNIKKEKMTQRNRRGAISKREERVERERERGERVTQTMINRKIDKYREKKKP